MDRRKSVLNVSVSVGFKIITMVMVILVKRFLIHTCGNDINGLNALYLSVIGVLSVVELGVGGAITFCMYRPIVEGDHDTVSALYHLFRKIYLLIGAVIFLCGLALIPFIHVIAKDYEQLDVNLGFTFFLMLTSVVLTYLYSSKTSLINAYKNNYITTAISSSGLIAQYVLQIVVLVLTRSFVWYLVCRIVAVIAQWIATDIVARKKYQPVLNNVQKINGPVKRELIKNIKAMFMHKVGYILVNSVDSVIISTFVGIAALGKYSNYLTILTSVTELIKLCFTSLTSVFGHLYVEADGATTRKYSEVFHLFNFALGAVFFLGYYSIIDYLVAILFSAELIVAKTISFAITLNGFVQFMRQSTLAFREATGMFYNDRWKPLFEGLMNLALSVFFVKRIGLVGVILATTVTNLLICHVVEPYVLYKHAFGSSPATYYVKNYSMIGLFLLGLLCMSSLRISLQNPWAGLLVNGSISVGISLVLLAIVCGMNISVVKRIGMALAQKKKKSQC